MVLGLLLLGALCGIVIMLIANDLEQYYILY